MTGGRQTSKINGLRFGQTEPTLDQDWLRLNGSGVYVPFSSQRLDALVDFPTPGTPRIPQIGTDGNLSFIDPATSYQPLDSDLTAIAALTTTTYGRSLLTTASLTADRIRLFGREVLNASTKPTTRGDSTALVSNDLWFDTTSKRWWYWDTAIGGFWLSCEEYLETAKQAGTINVSHAFPLDFVISSTIGAWIYSLSVSLTASAAWTANTSYFHWQLGSYTLGSTTGNGSQNNIGTGTIGSTNVSLAANYRGRFSVSQSVAVTDQTLGYQLLGTRVGTTATINSLGLDIRYRHYYK